MKTLTTLTAVAALLAGISIAGAQTSSGTMQKGSSMGAGSSTMGKQAAIGKGKFCIETTPGGTLNCKYASLSACQRDAKANNQACSSNPNLGTTGSK